MKISRFIMPILLVLLAGFLLAGCSGLDDLQIVNNYPSAVRVRYKNGDLVGDVSAESTQTFSGRAGYKGDKMEGMTYNSTKGDMTGSLEVSIERETKNGLFGTETWKVTLGGPSENAPAAASNKLFYYTAPLAAACFFGAWFVKTRRTQRLQTKGQGAQPYYSDSER